MQADSIVLVTRAGKAGSSLAARLDAEGWSAHHCPPVSLTGPLNRAACAEALFAALPADRVILTSPEGVRQAVALVGAEAFVDSIVIAPGPGTARLATALGLTRVVSPERSGDSEAMLNLPELMAVAGLRILILAAAGGRRLLEIELSKRGARVERLHVYRRLRCGLPDSLADDIARADHVISLISSGGALEALQAGLSEAAWQDVLAGLLLVPSRRVAELARQAGGQSVIDAGGADDESFCQALRAAASAGQLR